MNAGYLSFVTRCHLNVVYLSIHDFFRGKIGAAGITCIELFTAACQNQQ